MLFDLRLKILRCILNFIFCTNLEFKNALFSNSSFII